MSQLPRLSPEQQSKVDQFHASCSELLDRYVAGFERDMNRHRVKHGEMPEERAVYDMTLLLRGQIERDELPLNMAVGVLATAIVRGIARKRQGKG